MPYCVSYGTVIISGSVFYSLQILFQNFLVTAEKPGTGMGLTLSAGAVHIGLDLLFILGLGMGIEGFRYKYDGRRASSTVYVFP